MTSMTKCVPVCSQNHTRSLNGDLSIAGNWQEIHHTSRHLIKCRYCSGIRTDLSFEHFSIMERDRHRQIDSYCFATECSNDSDISLIKRITELLSYAKIVPQQFTSHGNIQCHFLSSSHCATQLHQLCFYQCFSSTGFPAAMTSQFASPCSTGLH